MVSYCRMLKRLIKKLGRFVRSTSVDELPQLFNVLER